MCTSRHILKKQLNIFKTMMFVFPYFLAPLVSEIWMHIYLYHVYYLNFLSWAVLKDIVSKDSFILCVCVCLRAGMCTVCTMCMQCAWKPEEGIDPPGLELTVYLSCPIWMLEIELGFPVGSTSASDHRAVFSVPWILCFLKDICIKLHHFYVHEIDRFQQLHTAI